MIIYTLKRFYTRIYLIVKNVQFTKMFNRLHILYMIIIVKYFKNLKSLIYVKLLVT